MSAQTIQTDKNLKSKILVARSKSKDISAHVAGLNVVIEVMPKLHHQCIYLVLLPKQYIDWEKYYKLFDVKIGHIHGILPTSFLLCRNISGTRNPSYFTLIWLPTLLFCWCLEMWVNQGIILMAKISFPGHPKCTEMPVQEPSTTATAMKTSLKSELAQPQILLRLFHLV